MIDIWRYLLGNIETWTYTEWKSSSYSLKNVDLSILRSNVRIINLENFLITITYEVSLLRIQYIIVDGCDKLFRGYLLMFPRERVFSIDRKKYCNYCISHLSSLVCNCSRERSTTSRLRLATICLLSTISHTETCQLFHEDTFLKIDHRKQSIHDTRYNGQTQSCLGLNYLKLNERKHFYAWLKLWAQINCCIFVQD